GGEGFLNCFSVILRQTLDLIKTIIDTENDSAIAFNVLKGRHVLKVHAEIMSRNRNKRCSGLVQTHYFLQKLKEKPVDPDFFIGHFSNRGQGCSIELKRLEILKRG